MTLNTCTLCLFILVQILLTHNSLPTFASDIVNPPEINPKFPVKQALGTDGQNGVILKNNSILAVLNNYRKRHGVPPLDYDVVLGQSAAKWAKRVHDKVILLGRVVPLYSHPHIEGENVFVTSGGLDLLIDGKTAIHNWYSEVQKYDFETNQYSFKTAQFTQLVWKRTRRLGMAVVYDTVRNFTVIVARFKPPGNVGFSMSFKENILPPIKDIPPPQLDFPSPINYLVEQTKATKPKPTLAQVPHGVWNLPQKVPTPRPRPAPHWDVVLPSPTHRPITSTPMPSATPSNRKSSLTSLPTTAITEKPNTTTPTLQTTQSPIMAATPTPAINQNPITTTPPALIADKPQVIGRSLNLNNVKKNNVSENGTNLKMQFTHAPTTSPTTTPSPSPPPTNTVTPKLTFTSTSAPTITKVNMTAVTSNPPVKMSRMSDSIQQFSTVTTTPKPVHSTTTSSSSSTPHPRNTQNFPKSTSIEATSTLQPLVDSNLGGDAKFIWHPNDDNSVPHVPNRVKVGQGSAEMYFVHSMDESPFAKGPFEEVEATHSKRQIKHKHPQKSARTFIKESTKTIKNFTEIPFTEQNDKSLPNGLSSTVKVPDGSSHAYAAHRFDDRLDP